MNDDAKDKPVRLRKEDLLQAVSEAVLRAVEGGIAIQAGVTVGAIFELV